MSLTAIPTLDELAACPERALELPPEAAAALLARVAGLQTALLARLLGSVHAGVNGLSEAPGEDRLLTIGEAAQMLRTSPDTLYRKWRTLPFAQKDSIDGRVKFSLAGIEKYLRQHSTNRA